jgi:hypothetical protein
MNIAGYALRPPRGPKDAMPTHRRSGSGIVMNAKEELNP